MTRGRGGSRRRDGERQNKSDEYGEWGDDYFSAKKAKLGVQLNTTGDLTAAECPQIFAKISIYINGYTNPPEPELRAIFTKHGGEYTPYPTAKTTFVIATNLPLAKKKLLAHKTIRPDWITDCVKAGTKLDARSYFLYNLCEESKQRTLSQVTRKLTTATSSRAALLKFETKSSSWSSPRESTSTSIGNEDKGSTSYHSDSELIGSEIEGRPEYDIDHESSPERDEPWKNKPVISTPTRSSSGDKSSDLRQENSDPSPVKVSVAGGGSTLRTTADEGFLDDFYKNSRLHLISTMKKETQYFVADWRKNIATHKFPLLKEYEAIAELNLNDLNEASSESFQPVIFHIDLDCFFVAVGRLSRPHLIDMPVAVTHSKGTGTRDSKSDIACASYEARAKGVSAGMWVDEAKRLCPNIQTIPYDFDEYRRVSKIFFQTVANLSLEIEAISCDELYLDATKVVEKFHAGSIASLASFLRRAIKESSKIEASIGIGTSKLSARIATRIAKENRTGQHVMPVSELKKYIKSLPVGKLPGVGYATAEKLNELYQIQTCEQLEKMTLNELKTAFGVKNGEKLYWLCRGVDNDPVNCDRILPKSLSAGCSFGVRFESQQAMNKFTRELANELSNRAVEARCFGNKLTLSLWIVRKEFFDPVKPGGHGAADVHSRTRPFLINTRDPDVIYSAASELTRSITQGCITPEYIRGVRISFDSLRYESEMSAVERKTVQNTIASSFAAMKGKHGKSFNHNSSSISAETSPAKTKFTSSLSPNKSATTGILSMSDYFKPKAGECAKDSSKNNGQKSENNHSYWIEQNLGRDQIDPSVWNALPSDIQVELEQANKLQTHGGTATGSDAAAVLNGIEKPGGSSTSSRLPSSTCSKQRNSVADEPQPCCSKSISRFLPKTNTIKPENQKIFQNRDMMMSMSEFLYESSDPLVRIQNTKLDEVNKIKSGYEVVLDSDTDICDRDLPGGTEVTNNSGSTETKPEAVPQRDEAVEIDAPTPPAEAATDLVSTVRSNHVIQTEATKVHVRNVTITNEPCSSTSTTNTTSAVHKKGVVPVPRSNSLSRCQMPCLNGVNTMGELKQMISQGVQGREATKGDTAILQLYLKELLHWQYLNEVCELISFLWELIPILKREGSLGSRSWVDAFLLLISETENLILHKYGGVYRLRASASD